MTAYVLYIDDEVGNTSILGTICQQGGAVLLSWQEVANAFEQDDAGRMVHRNGTVTVTLQELAAVLLDQALSGAAIEPQHQSGAAFAHHLRQMRQDLPLMILTNNRADAERELDALGSGDIKVVPKSELQPRNRRLIAFVNSAVQVAKERSRQPTGLPMDGNLLLVGTRTAVETRTAGRAFDKHDPETVSDPNSLISPNTLIWNVDRVSDSRAVVARLLDATKPPLIGVIAPSAVQTYELAPMWDWREDVGDTAAWAVHALEAGFPEGVGWGPNTEAAFRAALESDGFAVPLSDAFTPTELLHVAGRRAGRRAIRKGRSFVTPEDVHAASTSSAVALIQPPKTLAGRWHDVWLHLSTNPEIDSAGSREISKKIAAALDLRPDTNDEHEVGMRDIVDKPERLGLGRGVTAGWVLTALAAVYAHYRARSGSKNIAKYERRYFNAKFKKQNDKFAAAFNEPLGLRNEKGAISATLRSADSAWEQICNSTEERTRRLVELVKAVEAHLEGTPTHAAEPPCA